MADGGDQVSHCWSEMIQRSKRADYVAIFMRKYIRDGYISINSCSLGEACVAQVVEQLILILAQLLISQTVKLCIGSMEPAWDFLSLSFSVLTPRVCTLSLTPKINKK